MSDLTDRALTAGKRRTIALDAPVIPKRHVLRWLALTVVLALLVVFVLTLSEAKIQWGKIPGYIVSPVILQGLGGTLLLTIATMALAFVLGVVLAIMHESRNPLLRAISATYVWGFRAVPALLQLLLWFNIGIVIPTIDIPFIYHGPTANVMTPFLAALLGLGLSESAYMAEIIRSGILSIDRGQTEAALSLGMTPLKATRRIILPQALRVIIPPTGNEIISMLKFTSIAFAVVYTELLSQGARIYSRNFEVIEVLLAATFWYVLLVAVLSIGQRWVERHLDITRTRNRAAIAPEEVTDGN